MTTYTAISNSDIDAESIVDENLMTLMRDNPIAITEGAGGAPKIQTAAIAAAAIGRSEIANSTTTAAGSLVTLGTVYLALNDWALFPMIHTQTININVSGHNVDGGGASSPRLGLFNSSGGTLSYDVDHRWIIAA